MNKIQSAIKAAQQQITSDTPELDAQLIVCSVINKDRTFCFTYPETLLTNEQQNKINELVAQRVSGVPMAYLLSEKEFWSRSFIVTEDCLIPRPETELIIDWCLNNLPKNESLNIIDLGTGSGAIAITLAAERPSWKITATDISKKALYIAKQNAIRHDVTSQLFFHHGSWFDTVVDQQFDVIISNPPYIAEEDDALKYEPSKALYAAKNGLQDLQQVISLSPRHLKPNGFLILEHGTDQQKNVVAVLKDNGYNHIQKFKDFSKHDRMVVAAYEGNSFSNE